MEYMVFIGHVDADCFYVSAERVRYPHLHGLPVGVLGNHGACIIAKSYEMKAAGVSTGMPIWEAVPICPDGIDDAHQSFARNQAGGDDEVVLQNNIV